MSKLKLSKELIINTLWAVCKTDKSTRPVCSNVFQKENTFLVTNGHMLVSVELKGQGLEGISSYFVDNNKQIQVNTSSEVGNCLSQIERVSYTGEPQPNDIIPRINCLYLKIVIDIITKLSKEKFNPVDISKGRQDQVMLSFENTDIKLTACIMEIRK